MLSPLKVVGDFCNAVTWEQDSKKWDCIDQLLMYTSRIMQHKKSIIHVEIAITKPSVLLRWRWMNLILLIVWVTDLCVLTSKIACIHVTSCFDHWLFQVTKYTTHFLYKLRNLLSDRSKSEGHQKLINISFEEWSNLCSDEIKTLKLIFPKILWSPKWLL